MLVIQDVPCARVPADGQSLLPCTAHLQPHVHRFEPVLKFNMKGDGAPTRPRGKYQVTCEDEDSSGNEDGLASPSAEPEAPW